MKNVKLVCMKFLLNDEAENTSLRGSITVQLTYCLTGLDSADMLMLNKKQFYLVGQIQTSQSGGQPFSDTSPMLSGFWMG